MSNTGTNTNNVAQQCTEHSGCDARITNLETSDTRQWEAITKLQNRLPNWATFVFSFLTFLLGCMGTYAGMMQKFVELKGKP